MAKKKQKVATSASHASPASHVTSLLSCFSSNFSPPPTPLIPILPSILTLSKFFSPVECSSLRTFLDSTPLRSTTNARATKETARRHNDRAQLDAQSVANLVRDRLRSHAAHSDLLDALNTSTVEVPSFEVSPNIRLYRYEPGMQFGPHYDESSETSAGRTRWTVLIYFSDVESGGNTNFFPSGDPDETPVSVEPAEGKVLLHLHGDECMLHEGEAVARGTKYVFRTDLCF